MKLRRKEPYQYPGCGTTAAYMPQVPNVGYPNNQRLALLMRLLNLLSRWGDENLHAVVSSGQENSGNDIQDRMDCGTDRACRRTRAKQYGPNALDVRGVTYHQPYSNAKGCNDGDDGET